MPFIQVHLIEGRTQEQREKLAKAITDATAEILKVNKEDVWIQFVDMPKTHFAAGGVLRSNKK
jgi:4-oxalocrotonate tautomerase